MDILVTETVDGTARAAVDQLVEAGHRVHRCHEPGAPAFPCAGLDGSGCPLDATNIDLVLTVRPRVRPTPAPNEDGVACGLRRHVPVAVWGHTAMNPFEDLGAQVVHGDLVSECERIARGPLVEHERVATATLRTALEVAGAPTEPAAVSVRRHDGRLRVRITVAPSVPDRVREIAAVRVVGRLRELDTDAAGIDVETAAAPS